MSSNAERGRRGDAAHGAVAAGHLHGALEQEVDLGRRRPDLRDVAAAIVPDLPRGAGDRGTARRSRRSRRAGSRAAGRPAATTGSGLALASWCPVARRAAREAQRPVRGVEHEPIGLARGRRCTPGRRRASRSAAVRTRSTADAASTGSSSWTSCASVSSRSRSRLFSTLLACRTRSMSGMSSRIGITRLRIVPASSVSRNSSALRAQCARRLPRSIAAPRRRPSTDTAGRAGGRCDRACASACRRARARPASRSPARSRWVML